MAVIKAISSINNFNAYVSFTQDHASKYESSQVPLNMSSVLALKKICYFEVEYFSKYQETGAAFTIFEKILKWPPSKTWSILANDLISLLKYWIEGSRKYLIKHCTHWWQFVEAILKLINQIKLKDACICNLLAEHIFESLLDLATSEQLDLRRKYEVIRCLNQCSQLSSREVRSQLAGKFDGYFTKLCAHMSVCKHWPTQLVILELLLRWLVRRQHAAARRAAAERWLTEGFPEDSVQVFLERPFVDFFKLVVLEVLLRWLARRAAAERWFTEGFPGDSVQVFLERPFVDFFKLVILELALRWLVRRQHAAARRAAAERWFTEGFPGDSVQVFLERPFVDFFKLVVLEVLLRWLVRRQHAAARRAAAERWLTEGFPGDSVRVFLERPFVDFFKLELLLRWLVRRQHAAARRAAAERWLTEGFPQDSVQVFLERPFVDFFKDARDFLNALNKQSGQVTSVICRQLTVGNVTIISPTDSVTSWLDFNTAHGSATILLHPRLLPARDAPHELLAVCSERVRRVQRARCVDILTVQYYCSRDYCRRGTPRTSCSPCAASVCGVCSEPVLLQPQLLPARDAPHELLAVCSERVRRVQRARCVDILTVQYYCSRDYCRRGTPRTSCSPCAASVCGVCSEPAATTAGAGRPARAARRVQRACAACAASQVCRYTHCTVLLQPRLLPARDAPHELLAVCSERVRRVQRARDATQITLSVSMLDEPQFLYESTKSILDQNRDQIKISISSKTDVKTLDDALRRTFGDKYECAIETETGVESIISPSGPLDQQHDTYSRFSHSEHEEVRLSNSYEIPMSNAAKPTQRKKRASGYAKKQVSGWQSPSTISTTSLAQLPHKLAALPKLYYDKEPISVLAQPNLSCVTEVSEPDSLEAASTVKLIKPCGFVTRNTKFIRKSKTSPSDNEDAHPRCISPEQGQGTNTSKSLLYTTIGSTDDSERFERNKNNKIDLAELSLREALNEKEKNSRLNADDAAVAAFDVNSEAIDNTPEAIVMRKTQTTDIINKQITTASRTVISKSTSDESNTESLKPDSITARNKAKIISTSDDSNMTDNIAETPVNYVSSRRKTMKYKSASKNTTIRKDMGDKENNKPSYNIEDMEDFFSQHFKENKNGDLILSPTLARKINESSSDSDSFDKYVMSNIDKADQADINDYEVDADIIACLTSMVDKVCHDLDKCALYLDKEKSDLGLIDNMETGKDAVCIDGVISADESNNAVMQVNDVESDVLGSAKIKLSFSKKTAKRVKKVVNNKAKNKNKLVIKSAQAAAAQVTEKGEDVIDKRDLGSTTSLKETAGNESDTPLMVMKKRKLFSPNDGADEDDLDKIEPYYKDEESKKTPKRLTKPQTPQSAATCYKDIENDRKKLVRQPRNRRSKSKPSPLISPRTLKNNNLFDQLKENINSKNIKLVDKKTSEHDIAVYNFTSDSEDEDFKMRKQLLAKRKSEATIVSNESQSSKRGRPLKRRMYTESKTNSSTDETNIKTNLGKRKAPKRQNTKRRGRKPKNCVDQDLEDERMREVAPEPIITSPTVVKERTEVIIAETIEPVLSIVPEMEVITEDEETVNEVKETQVNKKKIEKTLSLKKGKKAKVQKDITVAEPEKKTSESPLPALIIEPVNNKDDDGGSICSSNLVKKCNNVMQGGDVNNDTTQNLLSDNDKPSYSPEAQLLPIEIEIKDKLEDITENKKKTERKDYVKPKKLRRKPKISQPEEIVLSDDPEGVNEVKSIARVSPQNHRIESLSITAHCDTNETLNEKILPRNLEIEDMSTSMKDYFINLRNQTNDDKGTSETSVKKLAPKSNSKDQESLRSPVVSIKRLEEDDIRKWLPSPKSSDSEAFQPKSIIAKAKATTSNVNWRKTSQTKANSISSATKVSDISTNVKKARQNIRKTAEKSKETSKFLKKTNATDKIRLKLNESESDTDNPRHNLKRNASQPRRTVISPISIDLTEDDDESSSRISEEPIETNITYITKRYTQTFARPEKTVKLVEKNTQSSSEDPSLNVTETSENSRKRKAVASHTDDSPAKHPRVDLRREVSMTESGPSIASVKEWFAKSSQSRYTAKDEVRSACTDFVENVLEKLDTTLSEIQQGTSSKLVHMFVDMQEQYNKMKEENTRMFEQLIKRQDERFEEFKQLIKQQAVELIKEDYTKKKDMVNLLREDLENIMEQLNRRKTY
ncbi:unnamed protein product [Plutella xylostella]|uniref:(diamondback moth) hypothetical protein n=1 Tax=Plutella xylostella TaxID=51655 RepID=A0A8S4F8H9_PLUXY|nr:unnamed protein product [Plutella xylostella]